jgi:ribonuclease HII
MSKPTRALAARLGDSKALLHYGASSLGEAWARAIASRLGLPPFANPDALAHALFLDDKASLRAPCPPEHAEQGGQCWGVEGERFGADDEAVAQASRDLDRLEKRGLRVRALRIAVVCTQRLNEAAMRGVSRFAVDLHTMERLVLTLREELAHDVVAVCGKVGGYDRYGDAFGPLGGRLHVAIEEGRARSEYHFPGVGRLAFVRDADASHLVVSLASLVGKWARDLLMNRIVRFYRAGDAELPDASGYHDPVTTRFIEATALVRSRRRMPDACFERIRAQSTS